MLYFLLAAGIVWGLPTIYLAYRFREYRKFLAGAFFVSWGNLLYLYFANVSVPLLGTNVVFTPESSVGAQLLISFSSCSACISVFSRSRKDRHHRQGSIHNEHLLSIRTKYSKGIYGWRATSEIGTSETKVASIMGRIADMLQAGISTCPI